MSLTQTGIGLYLRSTVCFYNSLGRIQIFRTDGDLADHQWTIAGARSAGQAPAKT